MAFYTLVPDLCGNRKLRSLPSGKPLVDQASFCLHVLEPSFELLSTGAVLQVSRYKTYMLLSPNQLNIPSKSQLPRVPLESAGLLSVLLYCLYLRCSLSTN